MRLRPLKPVLFNNDKDEWVYAGRVLSCKQAWDTYDIDFALWLDTANTDKEESMGRDWARA